MIKNPNIIQPLNAFKMFIAPQDIASNHFKQIFYVEKVRVDVELAGK